MWAFLSCSPNALQHTALGKRLSQVGDRTSRISFYESPAQVDIIVDHPFISHVEFISRKLQRYRRISFIRIGHPPNVSLSVDRPPSTIPGTEFRPVLNLTPSRDPRMPLSTLLLLRLPLRKASISARRRPHPRPILQVEKAPTENPDKRRLRVTTPTLAREESDDRIAPQPRIGHRYHRVWMQPWNDCRPPSLRRTRRTALPSPQAVRFT